MKAYQVQVGDRLPPSNIGQPLQTVRGVFIDESDPTKISIETDQGDWNLPHDTELLFPLRPDGTKKIFYPAEVDIVDGSDIRIDEIHVGDLVPNENGWRLEDGVILFKEAYMVTNIVFSGHGTYINLLSSVSNKVRRLYVPLGRTFLYEKGCVWEQYGTKSEAASRASRKNGPSTTSGEYMHVHTHEKVTFRIKGASGRPRIGSVPAPTNRLEWEAYHLIQGQRPHPADPRLEQYLAEQRVE